MQHVQKCVHMVSRFIHKLFSDKFIKESVSFCSSWYDHVSYINLAKVEHSGVKKNV